MKKGSLPPLTANLASKIVGIWMLKSREDVDAEGQILIDPFLGRDPIGILCFGPSHFAAQFMKRDRSDEENVPQRAQAKNNTAGVNGYDASALTVQTKPQALSRHILKVQFRLSTSAKHISERCVWWTTNSLSS